jgi:hypothetical protein
VLPIVGTPRPTPPDTAALPVDGTPGSDSWRITFLALAGLLATLLLLTPASRINRRR